MWWCWQWLGNLEGEKVFTLYHPSMRPYIERAENDWADLRNPIDAEAFPRFRKAVPAQTKLKAGEIIYIPRRWPCALFCPLVLLRKQVFAKAIVVCQASRACRNGRGLAHPQLLPGTPPPPPPFAAPC